MDSSDLVNTAFSCCPTPLLILSEEKVILTANRAAHCCLTPWLHSSGYDEESLHAQASQSIEEDYLTGLTLYDLPVSTLEDSGNVYDVIARIDSLHELQSHRRNSASTCRVASIPDECDFKSSVRVRIGHKTSRAQQAFSRATVSSANSRLATLGIKIWELDGKTYFTLSITHARDSDSPVRDSCATEQHHKEVRKEPSGSNTDFESQASSLDFPIRSVGLEHQREVYRPRFCRAQTHHRGALSQRPTLLRANTVGTPSAPLHYGGRIDSAISPSPLSATAIRMPCSRSSSTASAHNGESSTQSLEDRFATLRDAVYHSSASPGFILSADENFAYPNYRHGEDVTPIEIHDANAYFKEQWDLWDENFTRRLDVEEYPIINLVRERRNFKGRRNGLIRDGERLLFEARGECLLDYETKQFVGGVLWLDELGLFEDVKKQEKEKRLRDFDTICDSLPHMLWAAEPDGTVDYFSKSWYEYTGLSFEESLGGGWEKAVHPSDTALLWEKFSLSAINGKQWEARGRYWRHDEVWRWHSVRGRPVRDNEGNIVKIYGTITDVHEMIVAGMEGHRLEMENSRLHAQEREATESNRMKSQFLAHMSHELRTPIAGIIGMIGLLRDTNLTEDQQDYADCVKTSAGNLLTIVNDILDFSKIESGRLQIESIPFDPSTIVEELKRVWTHIAQQKPLGFIVQSTIPTDLEFVGDPGRLVQILSNLCSNALKFTSQGSITLYASLTKKDEVQFIVEDTGIGIKEHVLASLFTPFKQGDSTTARLFGGTGLGLIISRQLTESLNGNLLLESTYNVGTKATLTLPTNSQAPDSADRSGSLKSHQRKDAIHVDLCDHDDSLEEIHSGSASQPSTPKLSAHRPVSVKTPSCSTFLQRLPRNNIRILVVEDNLVNQRIAVKICEKLGFITSAVNNGKEALDYLTAQKEADICLMDCQMPILDGYEATRLLRTQEPYASTPLHSQNTPISSESGSHSASTTTSLDTFFGPASPNNKKPRTLKDLPIIALTASAIPGDMEKCFKAGMDDYLTKPLDAQVLEEKICKWVFRRGGGGGIAVRNAD